MFLNKTLLNVVAILSIASFSSVFSGCAGRAANVVMANQYGDETKSCQALESEMQFAQEEIARLTPQTNKAGKNTVLGVTGFFFIVPLFFMDLSKAEQEEINGYRQRYNHLSIIAGDRNCAEQHEQIPDFKNSKAFAEYQQRQLAKQGATSQTSKEPTIAEARAKVAELEAKEAAAKSGNFKK